MTNLKSSHGLLFALREHGSVLLMLVNNDQGYFAPGSDVSAINPNLEKEAIAIIHMDGNAPTKSRFDRIRVNNEDDAAHLIYMAGRDSLLPQTEYEKDASPEVEEDEQHNSLTASLVKIARSEYDNHYLFRLGHVEAVIPSALVTPRGHDQLRQYSSVLFEVRNGEFYEAKFRSRPEHNALALNIINGRVAIFDKAPEDWQTVLEIFMGDIDPARLTELGVRVPWMENNGSANTASPT